MRRTTLWLCVLLAACGNGATKNDPCPQGICIADNTGGDGGAAGDGGTTGSDACTPLWTCGSWAQTPTPGQFTRICYDINRCGTTAGKPSEGPVGLPNLDFDFYKCKVEPIFDRDCAFLGCHGTEVERLFKLYARGRLRHSEMVLGAPTCPNPSTLRDLSKAPSDVNGMDQAGGTGTVMCLGWSKHTDAEWQSNYDNARSFMVGLTNPDDSELLSQPVYGGQPHTGVHLFAKTDQDYQTIAQWLGGAKLGTACDTQAN
jgi:hypothetical protein